MDNLFNMNEQSKMKDLKKGDILISEPLLPDPNFERTVVLLTEHSEEEGSVGFIINKPMENKVEDFIEDFYGIDSFTFSGGPVEKNTLHFIHRVPALMPDSIHITDNIYWGGDFEMLKHAIVNGQAKTNDFKFFIGYSGWGPGQLAAETEANSWIIFKNTDDHYVFDTSPENLWKSILEEMGGKYKMFSNFPKDPRLN